MRQDLQDLALKIWSGWATEEDLAAAKREDVFAIKADCEHMRLRASVRKPRVDPASRMADHVASDETADRQGDLIRVPGWELESFKKNPQLMWMHDHFALPIGRVSKVAKGKAEDGRRALLTTSEFFDEEKNPHAAIVWRLVADGDLPAVSVGFRPLQVDRVPDADQRAKLGLGDWGVVYERSELLELSVVTVPANPNALMRKLDSLVEAGSLEKALALDFAKTLEPSTKVQVAVPEMPDADGPEPPDNRADSEAGNASVTTTTGNAAGAGGVIEVQFKRTPLDVQVMELRAEIHTLKSTLTEMLGAVRDELADTTRAVSAAAAQRVPADASTNAGADEQDTSEHVYSALLATVRSRNNRDTGPREG